MPPDMLRYRWFAKMYHWTPDQVRGLDLDVYAWLPAIETADTEAQAMRQRAEEARQRKTGGR